MIRCPREFYACNGHLPCRGIAPEQGELGRAAGKSAVID